MILTTRRAMERAAFTDTSSTSERQAPGLQPGAFRCSVQQHKGHQMIAGVVIDNWKLSIFKKHLDDAGFTYTEHPDLTPDTMLMKVTTKSVAALQPTIQAAQLACRNS